MTKLKICGLREVGHAVATAEAGADFLGFVFVPGVRRQLDADYARDVVRQLRETKGNSTPTLVGLFADQPLEEVNRILAYCSLDMAQLCGSEPPDYWSEVDRPVLKQLKVDDAGPSVEAIERLASQVNEVVSRGHICMLDAYEQGAKGGTGRTFDWAVAAEVARHFPIMLAGGLTPGNAAEAIETVRPWGVDVSSGVETHGTKDVQKIRAFAHGVKGAAVHQHTLPGRTISNLSDGKLS